MRGREGCAWQGGHVWQGGACMAGGGMHGRGDAWQGDMHGRARMPPSQADTTRYSQ